MAPRPDTPDPTQSESDDHVRVPCPQRPRRAVQALGGFATNGVNMTKLVSYMIDGQFAATQFLCDVEGHPEQPGLASCARGKSFFSTAVRVLGVYPAAPFRLAQGE